MWAFYHSAEQFPPDAPVPLDNLLLRDISGIRYPGQQLPAGRLHLREAEVGQTGGNGNVV